jgi:Glycine rich protein
MALGLFGGLGVAPSQARTAEPHEVKSCGVPDVRTGTRTCTYTFVHTDTIETFVVPATTKGPIQITATGAPGFGEDATKSRGAVVTGTFNFLSGTPLFVVVGGDGYYDGYNGGVGGGGGGSDIRLTMPDLQHRIMVAGGGGGGGCAGYVDQNHLCTISEPGSGGGGSSLVPPGGKLSTAKTWEPSVVITITQYV